MRIATPSRGPNQTGVRRKGIVLLDAAASPVRPYGLIAVFTLMVGGIVAGAAYFHDRQAESLRAGRRLVINGTTSLHAAQVSDWLSARIQETERAARVGKRLLRSDGKRSNPAFGGSDPDGAWLLAVLLPLDGRSMHIIDASGAVRLHLHSGPCDDGLAMRHVRFDRSQRDTTVVADGNSTGFVLTIVAPIRAAGADGAAVGYAVAEIDAAPTIERFARVWTSPSRSWETLLIQPEAGRMVRLKAPGAPPRTVRQQAIPLNDAVITQALDGRIGHLFGANDRGRVWNAEIMGVPPVGWLIIGREGREEVDRILQPFLIPRAAALASVVSFAYLALYGLWRARDARQVRRSLEQERTLSASQALFRTIIDTMPLRIFWKDRDSRYLGANTGFAEDAGISTPDELAGLTDDDLPWSASADAFRADDQTVIETGKPLFRSGELANLDGKGDRLMRTRKAPLKDGDGRVIGVLGVYEDITDEARARDALDAARAELEQRNRSLSELLYVTSHDLRSPLVTVQGFTSEIIALVEDLMMNLKGTDLGPEREKAVQRITGAELPKAVRYVLDGVQALDRMMTGIQDLARLDRQEYAAEPIDMDRIVRDVIDAMSSEIERAGARVDLGGLPPCRGDSAQIQQVFRNLLSNAVKYRAAQRPCQVTITGELRDGGSAYCVEDNGIGIAQTQLDRIFQMFHRAAPDHAPGDGLGLASVRMVVEKHGGRCWAESEPGKGSRFWFWLPSVKPGVDHGKASHERSRNDNPDR